MLLILNFVEWLIKKSFKEGIGNILLSTGIVSEKVLKYSSGELARKMRAISRRILIPFGSKVGVLY